MKLLIGLFVDHFLIACDKVLQTVLNENFFLMIIGGVASGHLEEALRPFKINLNDNRFLEILNTCLSKPYCNIKVLTRTRITFQVSCLSHNKSL